jgi:hypothetical protein
MSLLYIMHSRHLSDNTHQESFSMMYNTYQSSCCSLQSLSNYEGYENIGNKTNGLVIDG